MTLTASTRLIPLWIKLLYTAFMAVLIPVYLHHYGPTNFLYFCDVAAVMTLVAIWIESPVLCSAALVGIFIPQMIWVVDFFFELAVSQGWSEYHFVKLTGYMFDYEHKPFYLRFLSFFHFWLPFLLILLVGLVGYDSRGVILWIVLAWILMPVCFFYMPEPGQNGGDPNLPTNINYVYGLDGNVEQTLLDRNVWFAATMVGVPAGVFLTHLFFWTIMPPRSSRA